MALLNDYDPERPIPWQMGGFSQTQRMAEEKRTGMARWPANTVCAYCHEPLRKKHGVTPQGHALGWLLRGYGPFDYWCNMEAWNAWKRGLFHGLTELNGW